MTATLERVANASSSRQTVQMAMLNILEDAADERARLDDAVRSMLNILEDARDEKSLIEDGQKALLNILDDASSERTRADSTYWAMLNILEDALDEKVLVEHAQRALINILEDLEGEKHKVDHANVELARSNAELEQFAYVASHDLSEPLRAIAGPISLLARRYSGQLDPEADEFIAFAVDGCKRMKTMIDDLLTYSRIGRRKPEVQTVDLDAIAAQVLVTLAPAIAQTDARVDVAALPLVTADGSQVAEVLQNLVSNALKFATPGVPPQVLIHARRDGSDWRVSVTDNGIGIESHHRDRIWGMFQRLHTRDEFEGTGIGLAITKKIVERLGGRVGVHEGDQKIGSTFWFTLPSAERKS